MEPTNKFHLELTIDGYLQQLQSSGSYSPDDLLELKSHLNESIIELCQKQLTEEEAFLIAKKRLGNEDEINPEYKKVNKNVFYNRDLFVVILSICSYLFFYYLYNVSENGIRYLGMHDAGNIYLWGTLNYVCKIGIIALAIYLVFNSKRFINKIEKIFIVSPVNFSAVFIFILVVVYFTSTIIGKSIFSNINTSKEELRQLYFQFDLNNTLNKFIQWITGCVLLISILAAFIKGYRKANFLDSVINDSGYVVLFLIGLFWDGLAASARMINNTPGSAIAFGIVWFIGMLIFNNHLKKDFLFRNLVFISFGFILEWAAGIWMNPALKYGLPVSVFFIALIIGGGSGLLCSKFFKKKDLVQLTGMAS